MRLGVRLLPSTQQSLDVILRAMSRSGAAGGMLATARLTGQTVGAILAAISFRIAGNSETVALATGGGLAGIAAIASAARLYHPEGARPPKPAIVSAVP